MVGHTTPVKPGRVVPFIPIEIARLIAFHLDSASARNLALTCKALRDVGESGVWRVLDLTAEWYDKYYFEAIKANLDTLDPTSQRLGAITVDSKIKHAVAAFETYPFRLECVTTVKVQPSDGGIYAKRARALMKLLSPLAPKITRLEILPRPYSQHQSFDDANNLIYDAFFATMRLSSPSDYTRVTHFKYTCVIGADPRIPSWMGQMVNLQELEYCGSKFKPNQADDDGLDMFGRGAASTAGLKPFQHLRRLTFDQLNLPQLGKTLDIMAHFIELAPNLDFLRFRGKWNPQSHHRALKAMGKAKQLKTVVFSLPEDHPRSYWDEQAASRFAKLGRVGLAVEQAVVEIGAWEEGLELDLSHIKLPMATHLKNITIQTCARLSPIDYANLAIGDTPNETRPISGYFLRELGHTPNLTHILCGYFYPFFPPLYASDFIEPTYFTPPSEWAEGGQRGIVIREYRRVSEDDEDVSFWHMRGLTRCLLHPSGQTYVGIRRCWQDFCSYKGRTVPRDVLEAVYAHAGLELESVQEGRDLDLGIGGGAWDILDAWRDPLGEGKLDEGEIPAVAGWTSDDGDSEAEDVDEDGDGVGGQYMMGPHLNADGEYEDDDGVFDESDYDEHEPYWGYDMDGGDEDEDDPLG